MKVPARIARLFIPKEIKEMLEALKGKKTLLGILIVELTPLANDLAHMLGALGLTHEAELVIRVTGGVIAVLGFILKFVPEEKK